MVAYAAPLLERLEGGKGSPSCLVLCTGAAQATQVARSFGRLADGFGLRIAALAPHWNLPALADVLVVPAGRIDAILDRSVSVDHVQCLVVHDADGVVNLAPPDHLEAALNELPKECQRVFCGLPLGQRARSVARRYTRRAVTVGVGAPEGGDGASESARAGRPRAGSGVPSGPTLTMRVLDGDRHEAVLALVAELLGQDSVRHVLAFCASDDHAADIGDLLRLHGYACGGCGEKVVPVWLCGSDEEEAERTLREVDARENVATVSCFAPSGVDQARLRHAGAGPAWAVVAVRELGHMKDVARGAGFGLQRHRAPRPPRVAAHLEELVDGLHEAARDPRVAPYYLLVESLLDRFSAEEVAAAALMQLGLTTVASPTERGGARKPAPPESWVRLFVSAGERDEVGPGDLLRMITGRSTVPGGRVGRIDMRASHSLIEVRESDAKAVIAALNGCTLGGRSVRADYDRPPSAKKPGGGHRSQRPSAGRGGGRSGGSHGARRQGTRKPDPRAGPPRRRS